MGTKNNPAPFDCYANAEPDEPMFILLGRDPSAATMVRAWADTRATMIRLGVKPDSDFAMVAEARECADQMETFARQWAERKKAEATLNTGRAA